MALRPRFSLDFALVGFLQGYISTRFHIRALQETFKIVFTKQGVHAIAMDSAWPEFMDPNETDHGLKTVSAMGVGSYGCWRTIAEPCER